MKNRASKLDARVDKVAAGFTIIETILFIAIAGLVFTGVIVGTNGAIRRQRYKDSVNSITDDIRNLYSIVQSTEVLDYGDENIGCGATNTNTGRGRSACSVYGVIAKIQPNSKASTGTGENIEAYWLIGQDEREIWKKEKATETDSRFLMSANVSSMISRGGGVRNSKIEAMKSSLFWGAQLKIVCNVAAFESSAPCASGKQYIDATDSQYLYLIIYRSPISKSIRTMVTYSSDASYIDSLNLNFDVPDTDDPTKDELNITNKSRHSHGMFGREEVRLCVTAGDGMSYDGGLRMISIKEDAATESDVWLVEADDEDNTCN